MSIVTTDVEWQVELCVIGICPSAKTQWLPLKPEAFLGGLANNDDKAANHQNKIILKTRLFLSRFTREVSEQRKTLTPLQISMGFTI